MYQTRADQYRIRQHNRHLRLWILVLKFSLKPIADPIQERRTRSFITERALQADLLFDFGDILSLKFDSHPTRGAYTRSGSAMPDSTLDPCVEFLMLVLAPRIQKSRCSRNLLNPLIEHPAISLVCGVRADVDADHIIVA